MKELAYEIHGSVGVRMHRLGVCEWEVKLWMASSGQANGAWRVVVTNVTGHTCTVHVSVYIIYSFLRKGFLSYSSTDTSISHNNGMEGEVLGFKTLGASVTFQLKQKFGFISVSSPGNIMSCSNSHIGEV